MALGPRLFAYWSVVPILLKPDALAGPAARIPGPSAADFAAYLADAIALNAAQGDGYVPLLPASRSGADRARAHARAEMESFDWYVPQICDRVRCQQQLRDLSGRWAQLESVAVASVVAQACTALGFAIVQRQSLVVSEPDFLMLVADKNEPRLIERARRYLVGQRVELLLLCGQQENSALQLMKTYLRYVSRYPSADAQLENWVHVTNPNAANYPELIARLCHGRAAGSTMEEPGAVSGRRLAQR